MFVLISNALCSTNVNFTFVMFVAVLIVWKSEINKVIVPYQLKIVFWVVKKSRYWIKSYFFNEIKKKNVFLHQKNQICKKKCFPPMYFFFVISWYQHYYINFKKFTLVVFLIIKTKMHVSIIKCINYRVVQSREHCARLICIPFSLLSFSLSLCRVSNKRGRKHIERIYAYTIHCTLAII